MQDAARVPSAPAAISSASLDDRSWYRATVPGTVLTTLVDNKVYPEPLYGENMRAIPEDLNKTSYWYRTQFRVPEFRKGQHVWLHFGGINYSAEVWVNGQSAGSMRGAFVRGDFDVTPWVRSERESILAVQVHPQPHPGVPHEHTVANGVGPNGGETAIDGPTFLSTIGWDWLPAVRDRDTGIWQPVSMEVTGPVVLLDPFVTSELKADLSAADVTVRAGLRNVSASPVRGQLIATIQGQGEDIVFRREMDLVAGATQDVSFTPKEVAALRISHPQLWWPNGYGPQNLSQLQLRFVTADGLSEERSTSFGIRRVDYVVADSDNLTISVNGVRVMVRGGDWGLDEGLKRVSRERLDAQFRMHAQAHLNMVRNWVGQSTSPEFYEMADRYGLLLWDEFFQPNPGDGPNVTDYATYLANVKDKVLRYRNHPSITIWCARNEGYPPKELDDQLRAMMAELDPQRLYQSNSAEGRGVSSHGPYYWRAPRFFYAFSESFKTETGSVSIPTLESIQGMMPQKDWETINDDWAQHDMAAGAQRGNEFPFTLAYRYGHIRNLADFARKGAMATYETFRAMYEGRNAQMFRTTTGILTWMSHPAQPSFVWQLYHYDLEPNAALFAVQKASEPLHIQFNEANFDIEVVNNRPAAVDGLLAEVLVYDAQGRISSRRRLPVTVPASSTARAGLLEASARITPLYFVKLNLLDSSGQLLSTNFYWQHVAQEDFREMEDLPVIALDTSTSTRVEGKRTFVEVTLANHASNVALLGHLQLHRKTDGERVLPVFYSGNYISLVPGESVVITMECATDDLHGQDPLVLLDGFNVRVGKVSGVVSVEQNVNALPMHWPASDLVPNKGPSRL